MMFRSRPLHLSEHQRPFWLLVALAIMLLVSVSVTIAQAASPLRLAGTLKRDLGALRVQLELIDPWHGEGERRTVAFNADLGDGGAAYRRLSLVTIVRAAGRHLEWLIAACRKTRDDECRATAEGLRYGMVELTQEVDRLSRATSPASVALLRDDVAAALDRLDAGLAGLTAGRTSTLPARAGVPKAASSPRP